MDPSSLHSLRRLYEAEVEAALAASNSAPQSVGQAALDDLPAPVQRFMRRVGMEGPSTVYDARTIWTEMTLKRAREAAPLRLASEQVNTLYGPTRIALMHGHIAGVLPFGGRDKYQDGHGHMLIRLCHLFTVASMDGPAMDASGLVTCLSEAAFLPPLLRLPELTWSDVRPNAARATLSAGDLQTSGVFSFDDDGDMLEFRTDDRWQAGTPPRRIPWSVRIHSHQEWRGRRIPKDVSATWHEPEGDFTYVEGSIASVDYNVSSS